MSVLRPSCPPREVATLYAKTCVDNGVETSQQTLRTFPWLHAERSRNMGIIFIGD